MRLYFANSSKEVFEALSSVLQLIGKVTVRNASKGVIKGAVKRGMGAVWEPVLVSCRISQSADRTVATLSFEQKPITGIPDETKKAAKALAEHLARRKELIRLD